MNSPVWLAQYYIIGNVNLMRSILTLNVCRPFQSVMRRVRPVSHHKPPNCTTFGDPHRSRRRPSVRPPAIHQSYARPNAINKAIQYGIINVCSKRRLMSTIGRSRYDRVRDRRDETDKQKHTQTYMFFFANKFTTNKSPAIERAKARATTRHVVLYEIDDERTHGVIFAHAIKQPHTRTAYTHAHTHRHRSNSCAFQQNNKIN